MGLEPSEEHVQAKHTQFYLNPENGIKMTLNILKDKEAPWGTSVNLLFNPAYNIFTE